MPENTSWVVIYKDYILAALAGAGAAILGWFDMRRRVLSSQEDIVKVGRALDAHLSKHDNVKYITEPQHDKMQADCRALWKSEFVHIRETLETIKSDVREVRSKGELNK
jgi:hypothetical protein